MAGYPEITSHDRVIGLAGLVSMIGGSTGWTGAGVGNGREASMVDGAVMRSVSVAAWNGVCGVIFCLGSVMAGVNGCCTGTGGGGFDPSSACWLVPWVQCWFIRHWRCSRWWLFDRNEVAIDGVAKAQAIGWIAGDQAAECQDRLCTSLVHVVVINWGHVGVLSCMISMNAGCQVKSVDIGCLGFNGHRLCIWP